MNDFVDYCIGIAMLIIASAMMLIAIALCVGWIK